QVRWSRATPRLAGARRRPVPGADGRDGSVLPPEGGRRDPARARPAPPQPLSFTFPEHPDPDPAWLFDVGVATLYRLGGFPAVVIGKTVVVVAAFALAHHLCRRRGASA